VVEKKILIKGLETCNTSRVPCCCHFGGGGAGVLDV
jgi:hypothetical protein